MRYMGGKAKIAKYIAPIILESKPKIVIEPFCGALNVTHALLELDPNLVVHCYDANKDLINMWKAIQNGSFKPWEIESITEEEYLNLRKSPSSPLKTFVMFACSFGGAHSYARGDDRNYFKEGVNSTLRKIKHINRMIFNHSDYKNIEILKQAVVYCDPPYENTYKGNFWDKNFNSQEFWNWAESLECPVYISERLGPTDKVIWEKEINKDIRSKSNKKATDKLFRLNKFKIKD